MIPSGRGSINPGHCDAIVTNHDGIAAPYDSMGAEHRRMAKDVRP